MREHLTHWLETLSLWGLAALLATLPFWRHRVLFHRPTDPIFFEFQDVTLYSNDLLWWAAVGTWLLSRFVDRKPNKLRLGPWFLFTPLAGFVLLSVVGIPFAIDRLYAAYQTVRLLLLLSLYLLLVNIPLTRGVIAWPLAAGMMLQTVVALPQFISGRSLGLKKLGEVTVNAAWPGASVVMLGQQRWLRGYGLSQHPNLLAGCLMTMFLVVAGYYLMRRDWRRVPLLLALGMGFTGLLLTFSRAAWLGTLLGGGVVLLLLIWAWHRKQWSPDWSTIGLLSALLLVLILSFVAINWSLLQPRLGLVTQGTEIRSVEARKIQVPAALMLIKMRPLLGVGLGNYPTALYQLAKDAVAAYPVFQPVYNVPLLVAAELGIVAGLLWLFLILSPWIALWLQRWHLQITAWWAGLSGAFLALIVISFLDFYVWTSHQGRLALWIVLGLWAREWAASNLEKDQDRARVPGRQKLRQTL